MFNTATEIEEYLTTKGSAKEINIWQNLQESLDTDKERINFFNRVYSKNH